MHSFVEPLFTNGLGDYYILLNDVKGWALSFILLVKIVS